METFLIGLFALLLGALLVFAGYQFFRVLLPIWGFFIGFTWGAQAIAIGLGTGFLATLTGWLVGFIVAVVAAALAYLFYEIAVALLGASLGYWLVLGMLVPFGLDGIVTYSLAIIAAVAAGYAVFYWKAPKGLLIALTAGAGSTAVIAGTMVMFGVVPAAVLGADVVSAIISQSFFWSVAWVILLGTGIYSQLQLSRQIASEMDSSYYDYSTEEPSASWAGVKGGSVSSEDSVEEATDPDLIEDEKQTTQSPKSKSPHA